MKRGILMLGMAAVLGGCVPPGVEFTRTYCHRAQKGERLEAVTFDSSFRANGLTDKQILLEVQLLNRRGRLVRSADDRYRAKNGAVAVGKSFMVSTNPQAFENIRLTLPVSQMHLRAEDFPVRARFVVSDVEGQQLAVALARLPIESVDETYPPSGEETQAASSAPWAETPPEGQAPYTAPPPPPADAPPPAESANAAEPASPPEPPPPQEPAESPGPSDTPVSRRPAPPRPSATRRTTTSSTERQWFLPPADAAWPILRGPYESGSELLDQAYAESVTPVPLKPADRAWFVPVEISGESGGRMLLGPCLSERDAEAVAVRYHEMAERSDRKLEVLAPLALPLSHGLAQQAAGPKDTLVTHPD